MDEPFPSVIEFMPTWQKVQAHIMALSPDVIQKRVNEEWWDDEALKSEFDPSPIDRSWDWNDMAIEHEGRILESKVVGLVTDDGCVQGAMLVSVDSVPSVLETGEETIFVELLSRPLIIGRC